MAAEQRAHAVEVGAAVGRTDHYLAVERHRPGRERAHGLGDGWQLPAPIVTAACEGAHALAVAQADEPEPVVLDLIRPFGAGRHGAAHGRQAGLDEAGRMQRHSGTEP